MYCLSGTPLPFFPRTSRHASKTTGGITHFTLRRCLLPCAGSPLQSVFPFQRLPPLYRDCLNTFSLSNSPAGSAYPAAPEYFAAFSHCCFAVKDCWSTLFTFGSLVSTIRLYCIDCVAVKKRRTILPQIVSLTVGYPFAKHFVLMEAGIPSN